MAMNSELVGLPLIQGYALSGFFRLDEKEFIALFIGSMFPCLLLALILSLREGTIKRLNPMNTALFLFCSSKSMY